ncbi:metallothio multi-domain protein [Herbaspirillum sp.]|uniref:metallothio multi-domain protein n=1 Tax=Herbaspirillum sp. TaxID=1890675 RepID=UPI001B0FE1BD|nr:metallothio multi-domain protein [Herbaspirillum sp.]MBO9536269.1 metallothio multi-domain protein [Herbaspirillum sp.]
MTALFDRVEAFVRKASGWHIVLALLLVCGLLCWAVWVWATGEGRVPFAMFDFCITPPAAAGK